MSIAPLRELDKLTMAAARLQRANPNGWKDFMDAFEGVAAAKTKECVQAPPDKVIVAQGRAQQCADLLDLFANSLAKADALAAKMK